MELLRSLREPLAGFLKSFFTGQFGILPPVALGLQLALQLYLVGNPALSFGGTLFWGVTLSGIHLVCAFLILTMMFGAAFFSNKPLAQDAIGFVFVAAVISFVLTGLLALIFGFGVGFWHGLGITALSAVLGSIFDTVAVIGLVKRAQHS